MWEANFGTLASVANRWPIGLAHQHSSFSFAFPGQNAPPIAVWGGRTAENSRVLHRHSNWHSCPHRHNSAPLPCQAVHRCMRSSAMCAPVHRPTGSDLCSGLWLGQACSGSQASRLSHALLKKTITYLLHKIYFFIFYSRCTKSCIGLLAQNLTCVCPLPAAAARPPAFGLRPSACVSKLAQSSLPQACP